MDRAFEVLPPKRGLWRRLADRLFPRKRWPAPLPEYPYRECLTVTVDVTLDWRDRLRLALGGNPTFQVRVFSEHVLGHHRHTVDGFIRAPGDAQ